MLVKEMKDVVISGPTFLALDDELKIMRQLRSIAIEDILANIYDFMDIIRFLTVSHTDAFYEINESNKCEVSSFADWLDRIANDKYFEQYGGNDRLKSFASDFRAAP